MTMCGRGGRIERFFRCFFFNDTATTEIYTLSLHDALPISRGHGGARRRAGGDGRLRGVRRRGRGDDVPEDRKSTRLNSSHANISYAVFCLKKKKSNVLPTAIVLAASSLSIIYVSTYSVTSP